MKICPYCESEISETARKCKYCGEWVSEKNGNLIDSLGKTDGIIGEDNQFQGKESSKEDRILDEDIDNKKIYKKAKKSVRLMSFLIDFTFLLTSIGNIVELILGIYGKTLGNIIMGIKYLSLDKINVPNIHKRLHFTIIFSVICLFGGIIGIVDAFKHFPSFLMIISWFLAILLIILLILNISELFYKAPTFLDKWANAMPVQYKKPKYFIFIIYFIIRILYVYLYFTIDSKNSEYGNTISNSNNTTNISVNNASIKNTTGIETGELAMYYCRGIGNYLYEIEKNGTKSEELYNDCLKYEGGIIEDIYNITYNISIEKDLLNNIGKKGVIYCIGQGKYAGIEWEYLNNSIIEGLNNKGNNNYSKNELVFYPGIKTSLYTDKDITLFTQSCFGGLSDDVSIINRNLWTNKGNENFKNENNLSEGIEKTQQKADELIALLDKNMKDGEHITYYKNGNISSIINYKNGKKNGRSVYYFEDGEIEMSGQYKNGKQDGEWLYNYKNGTKIIMYFDEGKDIGDMIVKTGDNKELENVKIGKQETIENKKTISNTETTTLKENNKIDIQKENKKCSYDYPGTVYRESDGWCACPGDPKGTTTWNKTSKSCYKGHYSEITNWKEFCTNEKAIQDCAVGAETCPRECGNWIYIKPRSIEDARRDLGINQ